VHRGGLVICSGNVRQVRSPLVLASMRVLFRLLVACQSFTTLSFFHRHRRIP